MGKIAFLPQAVVNKTAAGEVIENPASVIKELVENALDAKATSIKIAVIDGGKSKIVVADDGEGMCKEDLLICAKPHSSGKVFTEEDLGKISTFGFRGEALNSVACVSNFSIKSHVRDLDDEGLEPQEDKLNGWQVDISFGEWGEIEPVGMTHGTVVEVQNLFSNFTARQQFLKSSQYEFQKILEIVHTFILSYPDVSFFLSHNGKSIVDASVHYNLEKRLEMVFNHSDFFLPINETLDHFSISGFLSMPQRSSGSFADLYFYVNKRPIKWIKGLQEIKKSYGTLLEKHQYPKGILFLDLPLELVDVNVHPRKEEIRIKNEARVLDFINKAVKDLLERHNLTYSYSGLSTFSGELYAVLKDSFSPWKLEKVSAEDLSAEIIQIDNTYLIASFQDRVLFLDQHAAHEKILYAQIMQEVEDTGTVGESKDLVTEFGSDSEIENLIHGSSEEISQVASMLACKNAVRAGDYLEPEERVNLVKKLLETNLEQYTCPHGRPTMIELSKHDLERMFKRI